MSAASIRENQAAVSDVVEGNDGAHANGSGGPSPRRSQRARDRRAALRQRRTEQAQQTGLALQLKGSRKPKPRCLCHSSADQPSVGRLLHRLRQPSHAVLLLHNQGALRRLAISRSRSLSHHNQPMARRQLALARPSVSLTQQ